MSRLALTAAAMFFVSVSFVGRAVAQEVIEIDAPLLVASATPIGDAIAAEGAKLAARPQDARPVAITYTEAHDTRAKIHKYSSWATLPLMATEFALGESLYNDSSALTGAQKGIHGAVGTALIAFFGVQSVTGVWNLLDSKEAPGQRKRLVHGLLMLAAEGGFVAAALAAPSDTRNLPPAYDANKATHRDIAIVSIGVGTTGYLLMLFTGGGK
jgi:hypothetical protein